MKIAPANESCKTTKMSGHDILYWFSNLWNDLTNLGTADIPSLVFRIVLLGFGLLIAKALLQMLWRIVGELLEAIWSLVWGILRTVTFPIWYPIRAMYRWQKERYRNRQWQRQQQQWERNRQQDEMQKQNDKLAAERAKDQQWSEIENTLKIKE